MIEIKNLLVRFNNILLFEKVKKNTVINVLYQVIGVKIKSQDIKIKNNTIYLNIKPIYKSEILLKKDKILLELKENLGKKTPQKIV